METFKQIMTFVWNYYKAYAAMQGTAEDWERLDKLSTEIVDKYPRESKERKLVVVLLKGIQDYIITEWEEQKGIKE